MTIYIYTHLNDEPSSNPGQGHLCFTIANALWKGMNISIFLSAMDKQKGTHFQDNLSERRKTLNSKTKKYCLGESAAHLNTILPLSTRTIVTGPTQDFATI